GTSLLVWSPDGKVLATACDGGVQLFDPLAGRRVAQCDNPANTQAHSLAFLADNKVLAAGTCGAAVRLWDVPSGRDRAPTGGHQNAVSGLAFSRDGKTLFSAGGDGVRTWATATWQQRRHLHRREDEHAIGYQDEPKYFLAPDGRHALCRSGRSGPWVAVEV